MDIDDFLDKELTEINSPVDTSLPIKEVPDTNLYETIKDNLEKGLIDDAEKMYIEMWQSFSKGIKWNKDLYNQLLDLSRLFSGSLLKSSDELKKKSIQISEFVLRARNSIKEGRKQEAMSIYNQLQALISSIPNVFFEEKKAMHDQIFSLYREITSNNESEITQKVQVLINDLSSELARTNIAMQRGNTDAALMGYKKCISLFNSIPEGFLRQRNPLGLQLLDIYKFISIQNEINELQKQLGAYQFSYQTTAMPQGGSSPLPYPRIKSRADRSQVFKSFEARKLDTVSLPADMQQIVPIPQSRQQETVQVAPPIPMPRQMVQNPSNILNTQSANLSFAQSTQTQSATVFPIPPEPSEEDDFVQEKLINAKKNISRGLLNEALKDVEDILKLYPQDAEAKALYAKIKTWQ